MHHGGGSHGGPNSLIYLFPSSHHQHLTTRDTGADGGHKLKHHRSISARVVKSFKKYKRRLTQTRDRWFSSYSSSLPGKAAAANGCSACTMSTRGARG